MIVTNVTTTIVDTAIGPVTVVSSDVVDFDVDDLVHTTVRAQAIKLQVVRAAKLADPTLAKNRVPINIDGTTLGGY
jgi:hypothetical protein